MLVQIEITLEQADACFALIEPLLPLVCEVGFDNCDNDPDNGCETDIQTDTGNCGSCGNACLPTDVCNNGACVSTCAPGQTDCGGVCVDLNTDPSNCGACGNVCGGAVPTCSAGVCQ